MTGIRRLTRSKWTERVNADEYYLFGEKYCERPDLFVLECLLWDKRKNEGPTPYQLEIILALVKHSRVSVRGPHGLGKSAQAAWLVLWFALTRDALRIDWKVPTTASGWRQLIKFLWPEIHKWSRRINWQLIGRSEFTKEELLNRSLKLKYGEAFALASNRSDLIEGAHADNIMYVFDESKIIPDATWDSAEGALVNSEGALWFSISTPGEPSGRFYEMQSRQPGYEDWWVRHVTLQEAIDAGRIEMKWAIDRLNQWGEDSAMYQNRVKGEFAQNDEDSLVPLHWIEQSVRLWHKFRANHEKVMSQMGIDVARMGGDKTVFAMKYGNWIALLEKYGVMDTNRCVGLAIPKLRDNGAACNVDVIGWGAGVYDNLAEKFNDDPMYQGDRIYPFHVQEKTDFMDETEVWQFADQYSAGYWNIRQMLDPDKGDERLMLPPDTELQQELTKFKYSVNSSGKIFVLRKEKVKEELGRSPDSADAIVLACWKPVEYGMDSG